MIAANYSTVRDTLKVYCDRVNDEAETVIITRKQGGNAVLLSEQNYNNLMENLYVRANPVNYTRLIESIEQAKAGGALRRELADE